MKADRRAKPRFRPLQTGHFICDSRSAIAGWISDISLAGVAFDYRPTDRHMPERPLVDIAEFENGDPVIRGIACRTVYDVLVLSENRSFKHGIAIRRCGLEFVHPSDDILTRVVDILARYRMEN